MKHCCCCFCDLATDLERFRTLEKYKMQGRRFVNPSDQNMTCVYLGTFKTTGDYLVRFYYYGQQIFLRTQNNMVRVFPQQSTRGWSSRCFQWKHPMLLALLSPKSRRSDRIFQPVNRKKVVGYLVRLFLLPAALISR